MRLELKQAIIRPWLMSDADSVQRYANNRKIWRNLRDIFPHPYTLEDAHAFLTFATQTPAMIFAIATESEAIGCIGLNRGADVHRFTAELGYWLAEPFWGRGIMSEAVAELSRCAFDAFDLHRIFAQPYEGNHASIRILEKAGYFYEGRMRASVFKDGKVLDSLLYARTRQ